MTWYGIRMYNHDLHSALKIEHQTNEIIQNKIESEIDRLKTVFKNKSDALSLLINNFDNPGISQQINFLLRAMINREPAIHQLVISSKQSTIITSINTVDTLNNQPTSSLINPHLVVNQKIPEVIIPSHGRIYIGSGKKHDDTFTFNVAVPIGKPVQAILIAILDVNKLLSTNLHETQRTAEKITLNYLIDQRGTLLTKIKNNVQQPGDLVTHLTIVRAALINSNWPIAVSYTGINKQPVYGTLTNIPSLNWTLISEVPTSKIIQPIWSSLRTIILITIFGIIFFVWLVLRLVNKTLKPIQQACEAIDHVARGEYDFTLHPTGIAELDAMTSGITHMTKSRQNAEHALQESEQDLLVTLNSIGDAVIVTDTKGYITRMNPIAEKLTGWSLAESQGQPLKKIFSIINATTRELIPNPVDIVLVTGETVYLSNHTTLTAKDGSEFQISDSAAPIRRDDTILGMVLVFNDVSEQYRLREQAKVAQQILKNKELEQREILNSMVNAVISIDENGTILSFNKAAETLFGYSSDEITGLNVKNLMPDPYQSEHDKYLQNYKKTGTPHIIGIGRNVFGQRKNKSRFPMRLLVAELPKATDGKKRYIGSCIDLTQIQEQEQQLRHSQKMDALGKLTGGIAHDYNNILGIVLGYTEQIIANINDSDKIARYANNIKRAADRGSNLAKKLLAFSRHKLPDVTVININDLLQEQQQLLEKTLTVRIQLSLQLSDNLWLVELDSGDLEDAIINMSINALHAMEPGGSLTISTSNEQLNAVDVQSLKINPGDYVLLTITDTGTGMDEITKEKIFDPFFSTKGERGTGLGLSQVYGFVERSGGAIKVYSGLGYGTRFALYFPRSKLAMTKAEPELEPVLHSIGGTEAILVVDDEQDMVDLAYDIFTTHGYQVLTANDGKHAITILENHTIDLVISDVIMPNMDGYQLAAHVRKNYPKIKLQMVSGFADERHRGLVDNKLHENMIHKPYASKILVTRIRQLLDEDEMPENVSKQTILILDDDEDTQELFKINLAKLNFNVISILNGEQAVEVYKNALMTENPVNLVIVDLSIPGSIGGQEVAEQIRRFHPAAKIIVSSGNTEGPEMQEPQKYGFDAALEKNFDFENIKYVIKNILN